VPFPPCHEATWVMEPREESVDLQAPLQAAEWAAVVRRESAAAGAIRAIISIPYVVINIRRADRWRTVSPMNRSGNSGTNRSSSVGFT
jgi:hypothetical protein